MSKNNKNLKKKSCGEYSSKRKRVVFFSGNITFKPHDLRKNEQVGTECFFFSLFILLFKLPARNYQHKSSHPKKQKKIKRKNKSEKKKQCTKKDC